MKECAECGAKMVKYRHSLNRGLVESLFKLWTKAKALEPIALKSLNLTRTQWDNFQKLRYWGLVEQSYAKGKRLRGFWQLTPFGAQFIELGIGVCHTVVTYRGDVVDFEGPIVTCNEKLTVVYKKQIDYARNAEAP